MRTYDYFYVKKTVYGYPAEEEKTRRLHSDIFLGIRAQSLLLKNGNIYKNCGLYLQKEIKDLTPTEEDHISSLIISNTNDKKRLGLIKELTFTLVPLYPDRQLNPYNNGYNTGLPYSTNLSYQQILSSLKSWRINFVDKGETYVYKIELYTIKEMQTKKHNRLV